MGYKSVTPDQWVEKLKAGGYQSATSAIKAIAKVSWDIAEKDRAKKLIKKYFDSPAAARVARPAAPASAEAPAAKSQKGRKAPKAKRQADVPFVSPHTREAREEYACRVIDKMNLAADAIQKLKSADGSLDISEAQTIVNNVMVAAIVMGDEMSSYPGKKNATPTKLKAEVASPDNGKAATPPTEPTDAELLKHTNPFPPRPLPRG